MLETPLEILVQRYLELHAAFHPVDATFMGLDGHDHRLPPADLYALERERAALRVLQREADQLEAGAITAEQLERRMLQAQLRVSLRELEERSRYGNPAWYTGEAAFGLISLLLPSEPPRRSDDLRQRLEALPAFLEAGANWLSGAAIPADWVVRALQECAALIALLERGLPLHELWSESFRASARVAVLAVQAFSHALIGHADRDPASGEIYLEFLMREAHGLTFSPKEAEELALEGFETAQRELQATAARLDAGRDWRTQLAALDADHPATLEDVIPTYQHWQARTLEAAEMHGLVTPADGYGLDFQMLPAWAHGVAGALYFLFYRSPAAGRPGAGSPYWVFSSSDDRAAYLRSQNTATIKSTHVVHHGSIGHHTQNARARASHVRLGQVAGTDCAAGIAMLGGGTMIEGWACYTQELMLEVEGFYSPLEELLQKHNELRNTAMCLADIRLHRGVWNLAQMRDFYRDGIGIPEARVWAETTRNSIYPSTRLMYWLGTQQIKAARERSPLSVRDFHDELLRYGSLPMTWVLGS